MWWWRGAAQSGRSGRAARRGAERWQTHGMALADASARARARACPSPSPALRSPLLLLLLLLPLVAASAATPTDAAAAAAAAADAATRQLQQYDALRVARCAARCWTQSPEAKDSCEEACLRARYAKPGACPDAAARSAFDEACLDACAGDEDCSATDKCCAHACGVTCQRAQGLLAAPGLPAVPRNVSASERRHGRVVVVEWAEAPVAGGAVVLFVVEERHHVGCHLAAERLGPWTARHRSARAGAALRGVVRPGRWYQFRVAAVGANGTRGFSAPSRPFKLSAAPRAPDPPPGLRVGPLSRASDGLRAELSWQRPPSDLPVLRYKVFWSRRLHGEGEGDGVSPTAASTAPTAPAVATGPSTTTAAAKQASVLVHHQTVGGDVLQFMLRALEPNSLYFLQVQAIAQYGRERLKSGKGAIFLNTGAHPINGSIS